MQPKYLERLSEPVQQFVLEVENASGVRIDVLPHPNQNEGGTTGHGTLAVGINAQSVQLYVPTNGYFPDGAVRHEVLHVRRFHVERVPRLVLAATEPPTNWLSEALTRLDNAIEHVFIVPVELQHNPERHEHWEAVMRDVCTGLSEIPEGERRLAVCLHWAFLLHVLPNSPQVPVVKDFAMSHRLLEMADKVSDAFRSRAGSKEDLVRFLFFTFPEIPRKSAALEYINRMTGANQTPIP